MPNFHQGLPFTVCCAVYVLICIVCSALTLTTYLNVDGDSNSPWLVMFALSIAMTANAGIVACIMVPTCMDYMNQRLSLYVSIWGPKSFVSTHRSSIIDWPNYWSNYLLVLSISIRFLSHVSIMCIRNNLCRQLHVINKEVASCDYVYAIRLKSIEKRITLEWIVTS